MATGGYNRRFFMGRNAGMANLLDYNPVPADGDQKRRGRETKFAQPLLEPLADSFGCGGCQWLILDPGSSLFQPHTALVGRAGHKMGLLSIPIDRDKARH